MSIATLHPKTSATASLGLLIALGIALALPGAAHALSELQTIEQPKAPGSSGGSAQVPLPGVTAPDSDRGIHSAPDDDDDEVPGYGDAARPPVDDPNAPLPEVVYDLSRLPAPVREMRDKIVAAAKSGAIEALRPLIGTGDDTTQLSLGGIEGDPITYIKELSGDPEGQEILAILEEVLDAGFVHLDVGTPEELYVWPYFFAMPLERLDARQRVELFKIVTAGDYEDMKSYGSYIFYRVGITPTGRWLFFVAGD